MSTIFNEVLYRPLFNILILIYHYIPDIGFAIIILTIIIRLILYPSQAKALRAQKKLNELQPEIQKIQEKYKNDKQKQAKATMEFYKTHKVSPFSSCLPTLIQLPIIWALYSVFSTGLNMSRINELYSFVPKPEIINPIFLGLINLSQPERIILPILAGITQFIQVRMMMPPQSKTKQHSTQQMISKQMVYLMPLMIVFFAASLPAALPLYWIVISLFGIFQQYMINKEFVKEKVKVRIRKR